MGDRLEWLAESHRAGAVIRVLVELAVERQRLLARHDPPDDLHVLARAGEGLAIGLAVPPFDDLRPRHAEPQDEPSVRQVIERDRVHRGGGRRARRELHDGGAELDPAGLSGEVGERPERIGPPSLGRPDRVEAEVLGELRGLHQVGGRQRAPIAPDQAELHRFSFGSCRRARVAALGDYLPWKLGVRFSLNARGPSLASCEPNTSQP